MPACVTSPAVTVQLPTLLNVTLKVLVPEARAALAGSVALLSLEVIAAVSFVLTTFQLSSTALAVTLNAVPAVCAVGVPVFPVVVPGAAVSPGINNCSLASTPALIVIEDEVLAVLVASVTSVAVAV